MEKTKIFLVGCFVLLLIIVAVAVFANKENFTNKIEPNYQEFLCSSRMIYNNKINCSSIPGLDQRPQLRNDPKVITSI